MKIKITSIIALIFASSFASSQYTGYFAPPNNLSHLTNAPNSRSGMMMRATASLPTKYDLRNIDGQGTSYLTSIKRQNPYGTCWAFSAMACLEYQVKKSENFEPDFSENNLANMHGFGLSFDQGGNNFMAAAVFLREEGPVTEKLDPYPNKGKSVKEHGIRIPRKIVFVPNRSSVTDSSQMTADLNAIKNAVINYGPLMTSYYHSDTYLKSAAYYYSGSSGANHAVVIVGWDDNYSASNFKQEPPGDGAFIIRNSWGLSSGENGYLYISYYDTCLGFNGSTAFLNISNGSDYGKVFQYDKYGYVGAYGYNNKTVYFANLYTADEDYTLSAFGFYALEQNIAYEAYIIKNPTLSGTKIIGNAVQVKTGTLAEAGYEVIPFNNEISISKGETFLIKIKLTSPSNASLVAATCNTETQKNVTYVSGVIPQKGLSFISSTGSNSKYSFQSQNYWEDLSQEGIYACCKVYTKPKEKIPTSWLDICAQQSPKQNYLSDYFYNNYNGLAAHVEVNGYSIEQSFNLGLDPFNKDETNLLATITFDAQGKPVIGVSPKNDALWSYKVLGSQDLKTWHEKISADKFFKVSVTPTK